MLEVGIQEADSRSLAVVREGFRTVGLRICLGNVPDLGVGGFSTCHPGGWILAAVPALLQVWRFLGSHPGHPSSSFRSTCAVGTMS